MRCVVQVAREAAVSVDGEVVGALAGPGLVVLVGVTHTDTETDAVRLAAKVHDLRILPGERSAAEVGAPLLVVSQFTLYADTRKGRRPSFTDAAVPDVARPLIERFAALLSEQGVPVQTGKFGADMQVEIHNNGPVTILLDL